MLKPLLLLCCTAIFVSAGDQKINGTNGTSISVSNDLSKERVPLVQPQSLDNTKSAIVEHQPSTESIPSSNPSKSDSNIKSKISDEDSEHDATTTTSTTVTPTKTTITSTTTPSTTTTSTTPSTTTTVPTTTTTPAPTTPVPPPTTKKWVLEQNNTKCIVVQMAAQFDFSYTVNNKTIQKLMDIPGNGNGTVSGTCGKDEQNLTVSWNAQNTDNFTLHFKKNETTKRYSLHHFEISLAPEEFPADKWNKTVTLVHMTPQYETGLSNSYRCMKEQKLNLYIKDVNDTSCVGHLTMTNLQFQAFRGDNSTTFGLAKDCAFDTPDIVPITVGCALAGLVVIVLIAYLVGRRRSQARGYLSM